jgi:hypothetical protein
VKLRATLAVLAVAAFAQAQSSPPTPASPAKEYIRLKGKVVAIASRNVANVGVTITANSTGPSFTVDGSTYTGGPLNWTVGSVHTISTVAIQAGPMAATARPLPTFLPADFYGIPCDRPVYPGAWPSLGGQSGKAGTRGEGILSAHDYNGLLSIVRRECPPRPFLC